MFRYDSISLQNYCFILLLDMNYIFFYDNLFYVYVFFLGFILIFVDIFLRYYSENKSPYFLKLGSVSLTVLIFVISVFFYGVSIKNKIENSLCSEIGLENKPCSIEVTKKNDRFLIIVTGFYKLFKNQKQYSLKDKKWLNSDDYNVYYKYQIIISELKTSSFFNFQDIKVFNHEFEKNFMDNKEDTKKQISLIENRVQDFNFQGLND